MPTIIVTYIGFEPDLEDALIATAKEHGWEFRESGYCVAKRERTMVLGK